MAEDKKIEVEIVTPQKAVYKGTADSVTVPGAKSPFQVLYNHAPIVSALEPGIVKITEKEGTDLFFAIASGFTEVRDNKVSILTDRALAKSEIDKAKISIELENALQISKTSIIEIEKEAAILDLAFAESCLKVIDKN